MATITNAKEIWLSYRKTKKKPLIHSLRLMSTLRMLALSKIRAFLPSIQARSSILITNIPKLSNI